MLEAGAADERVAKFGRKRRVQPDGRRLGVERLQLELLRACELGLLGHVRLLVLAA